ncbi:MAG: DUF2586 family protein [Dysgonamonadaceae bacterium]|jgi:hypothetical protein|nr:DUF2586 family protein [Dysgonamonadaceae bacterium]
MLQQVNIIRENSSLTRFSSNQDRVSGILFSDKDGVPSELSDLGMTTINGIAVVRLGSAQFFEQKQSVLTGVTSRKASFAAIAFFNANPSGVLWLGIKLSQTAFTAADVVAFQTATGGEMRQTGIDGGDKTLIAAIVTMEANKQPCLVIGNATVASAVLKTQVSPSSEGYAHFVGTDAAGGPSAAEQGAKAFGEFLGNISKAQVHESTGWVSRFPSQVAIPGFCDGTALVGKVAADLEAISAAGYIFFCTYPGLAGVYYSGSNCTKPDTTIEAYRTMNKACRGIYASLVPELGRPLYVDPVTGKLSEDTCAYLEMTAQQTLDDMEKAGELSGWAVEIDREQNVLVTSTVEIAIKQVPVGVMRTVNVRISFVTNV